ncbi:MAG: manganese ABC transporter permease MntC [Thermoflexibacter sp.]
MQDIFSFFSFREINVVYVVLGSILLSASSAIVGTFTFLKKKSLVGDAVAHAVLPGVCLAFLAIGTKNPLALIVGAFLSGWLSMLCIDWIVKNSKLKEDTAVGLVLSVFFGVGILLLTSIQHSGNEEQAGLDSFLFGKAAALVGEDLAVFASTAIILVLIVLLFFKEFKLIAFDEHFAKVIGLPVKRLEFILTTLTVLAVIIGIQAVGVVLMAAMLITPPAAARYWTDRLATMVLLSAIMGAVAGFLGAFISYLAPAMPTGPWIILVISFIALFSFLFAPRKGLIAKFLQQRKYQNKFTDENILKLIYHLGEKDKLFFEERSADYIKKHRLFQPQILKKSLQRLREEGYLSQNEKGWAFTKEGYDRGKRIVRLHRLWELYLTEYLRIAPDHVHDDAETMEHIITPEIEKQLEHRLQKPKYDPHQTEIPYE